MSKPAFDPSKPYRVIEKPPFDPSKPFKEVVFEPVDKNAPKKREEITSEMIMGMIQDEIKKAISSQKIVERVIENKITEKEVPRDIKTVEKIIVDGETKKSVIKLGEEIEKLRHAVNFIIPARMRSKEHYEVTNIDQRRRAFDVTSATVDELYQVVGTLIADLKAAKILS